MVTPGYIEAKGIPLRAGQAVVEADAHDAQPIVVINEKLAWQQFPGENPLGKQIWIGHAEPLSSSSQRTIFGVVADTHMYALERDPEPGVRVPMAQQSAREDIWRDPFLVAYTGIDPINALASLIQMIRGIDPQLAIADVSSMEQRLRDSLWRQRFSSSVLGACSLAALEIAVLGVFGVTSYLVALPSHEIGVRLAVGARPVDILRMVLRQSFVLVAIGIGIGLLASIGLTRVLQGLLFAIKATDSLTFAVVVAILMISALVACLLPAERAANADPVVALRMG